jgi:hypothetical protein
VFEVGAVGATTGGMCAGLAGLAFLAERLPGINRITNRLQTDRAQALLILTAAYGLVSTPAGRWWHHWVDGVDAWASDGIGHYTGLFVTGVAGLVVLLYLINDMVTRRIEMRTRVLAAVMPVLGASIPGPVGAFVVGVLGYIAYGIAWGVGKLFGIGG